MMTALYLLFLLIPSGGCKGSPYFTTHTTAVGQSVYLRCPQEKDLDFEVILFWIRLRSGTFPEVLAHNKDLDKKHSKTSSTGHHIVAKEEIATFVLQINQVQKSDMAVYYCFKWTRYVQDVIFLKGIFLQVKDFPEEEPSVITVTQDMRTDGSLSGPSVTPQCSVLPHSETQTCFDGHKVYWFRAETNGTHPSFIYTREECDKITGGSMQKCVHVFSKNISSSDAVNYLCAVATCGEIFMKNAKKIITEDSPVDSVTSTILLVLSAMLVLCLLIIACLIRIMVKKNSVPASTQSKDFVDFPGHPILNRKEDSPLNSTVFFTMVEGKTIDATERLRFRSRFAKDMQTY